MGQVRHGCATTTHAITLADFLDAYNFARRLKTLNGLTPYEYICKIWTFEPQRFIADPIHQMPGLNTWTSILQPAHLFSGQARRQGVD